MLPVNMRASWLQVERHWASFWHEAELMSRLNHPNVLRFYGLVVKGPLVVGIMMEFAKNGSLSSYLRCVLKRFLCACGQAHCTCGRHA